jgi:hypothetical protein
MRLKIFQDENFLAILSNNNTETLEPTLIFYILFN